MKILELSNTVHQSRNSMSGFTADQKNRRKQNKGPVDWKTGQQKMSKLKFREMEVRKLKVQRGKRNLEKSENSL